MLAYRHAFHAGSHADVLKHVVLAQVLRYMGEKDKPYTLVDSHAGAGGYSLEGRYAQKKGEFETGIGKLWGATDLPPPLADYVALVKEFNGGGALEQYPGSPALAQMLLRKNDRLRLYELHPTDHKILEAFLGQRPQTHVAMSDGFAGLERELPPPSRRGVVLIDPSYELKSDYGKVVVAVREALQHFAQAVMLVWYPQVALVEAVQLPKRLTAAAQAAPRGWLNVSLHVQPGQEGGFGMTGSGMFVINPPWVLHQTLQQVMPALVDRLGQYDGARFVIEHAGGAG
jgi:23S rRNA (adenine2030-N6)-methyltransferase